MFPEAAVACGSPEAAVASVQAGASSLPLARSERIKISRWMTRLAPTFAASRRAVVCAITAGLSASFSPRCSHAATTLSDRFDSSGLLMPPLLSGMESLPGDLRYPSWLAGTWRVTNTNSDPAITFPLGPKFVDPLLVEEVQRTSSRRYQMRFVQDADSACGPPEDGLPVRQDRRFNNVQEEGAFTAPSGFVIERGAFACDAAHPHGMVLLDRIDTDATGAVRPRAVSTAIGGGPSPAYEVVQRVTLRSRSELDILWAACEQVGEDAFLTSEFTVQRETLSSGEELGISFLELLTKFERPAGAEQPMTARASYKVIQYLSSPPGISRKAPSSRVERALEREAAGRAVAILNYDLLLERVDS